MGTGRQSVPPAPGSPAGHRSWPGRQQAGPQGLCQGWQGHGDRARAGTSLGTEQRKGSGERPRTGQGWHCRKCPAELVWQTVFNQHWHHQASCLAGEFSESGHCWIFKNLRNRSTRNHLMPVCFQGTPESTGSLKPRGLVHQQLYPHHIPGTEGGHGLRVLSPPCHSPK